MMKVLLVGGNFQERIINTKVTSGAVTKLGEALKDDGRAVLVDVVNGGTVDELNKLDLNPYDLVIWMANVDNSQPKKYPTKRKGSVMVVSKRLSEGRTELDAVSRIFGMHANAVIAIKFDEGNPYENKFTFKLLDALGNSWVETAGLQELSSAVLAFTKWNGESQRVGTSKFYNDDLEQVVELNKIVADKFERVKSRYFGNVSTRCMKMSPTKRISKKGIIFVSKRNVSKQRLTVDDMVLAFLDKDDSIKYLGDHKPSVDTPIQLQLYKKFSKINYMIHGHAYVRHAIFTDHYYPCGDLREVDEVCQVIPNGLYKQDHLEIKISTFSGVINLKNHGFLIYAETLNDLRLLVNDVELIERPVGEKL